MRVTRGPQTRKRRKKILKRAKGFRSSGSRLFTVAIERSDRALCFQYRDRKNFKNEIRKIWNHRIGAAARNLGLSYSQFMGFLKKAGIELNRPQLAYLALKKPSQFKDLAEKIQPKLG